MKKILVGCLAILIAIAAFTQGNVGIGTNTPLARLHIIDSNVVFSAAGNTPGIPGNTPINGQGRRMMWYPDRAAFRAGYVSGNNWDQNNIGYYSVALGNNTKASGLYAIATGNGTIASGQSSTSMGELTTASSDFSTALGRGTIASGPYSTAMGNNSLAIILNATAMGDATTASGIASTSMGSGTLAAGAGSTSMGFSTTASGQYATATGDNTDATGTNSFSMGENSTASGYTATAMGSGSIASGDYSFASGEFVTAKAGYETVIGRYNTNYTPLSTTGWNVSDRLFVIANGTGIGASSSNAMTVLKNGNVGIATTIPIARLHIKHNSFPTPSLLIEETEDDFTRMEFRNTIVNSFWQINARPQATATNAQFEIWNSSSGSFTIPFIIKGNGDATLAGILTQNSDARLKKDICIVKNALQKITQLNGYNYKWKNENSDNSLQTGVLAQEVQNLFPELVKEDNKGVLSVNYIGLIPVMIESIKEQQRQIDDLKLLVRQLLQKN